MLAAFLGIQGFDDISVALQKIVSGVDDRLTESLPAYMHPAVYIPLRGGLPITGTGKLDRRQLKQIGTSTQWQQLLQLRNRTYHAPSTEVEMILCAVWSGVLNLPKESISVEDAFTRLGGDSISAMQVVSRCRERSLTLTVKDILAARTIRKIADQATWNYQILNLKVESEDLEFSPWPLSPIQHFFF